MRRQSTNRRDFLKATVAGAAGIGSAGIAPKAVFGKTTAEWPRINPSIDNLRVVCVHDAGMITGWPGAAAWNKSQPKQTRIETQNAPVVKSKVQQNLDKLAVALTQQADSASAWATIFQKPSSKGWGQVKVAVKVNCLGVNHPRLAVVDKVCKELINLNVSPGNIVIYDGSSNANGFYSPFVGNGLPAGVVVSNKSDSLGGTTGATIPAPDSGSFPCTTHIANGTIDIIVNISVNKNHGDAHANATLTMKNHYGTFHPMGGGTVHRGTNYLIAVNKSDAIVGGNPTRQQLCIVDSLWASTAGGPGAVPDKDTCRLVMGTFGPAVDYLSIKKIREAVMGATHLQNKVLRLITEFGYTQGTVESLDLIDATLIPTSRRERAHRAVVRGSFVVAITPAGRRATLAAFRVPEKERLQSVSVATAQGKLVRRLSADGNRVQWNGTDAVGRAVPAGHYVVRIESGGHSQAKSITIE